MKERYNKTDNHFIIKCFFRGISDDGPRTKVALIVGCVAGGGFLICAVVIGMLLYSKCFGRGQISFFIDFSIRGNFYNNVISILCK